MRTRRSLAEDAVAAVSLSSLHSLLSLLFSLFFTFSQPGGFPDPGTTTREKKPLAPYNS